MVKVQKAQFRPSKWPDVASGDVGEIDGISGATVTTDAILSLVNNAYKFISEYAGN